MKAITLECQMTGASTRSDGSLSVRFCTPELCAFEKTAVLELHNKNLKMLLQPMGEEPEELVEVKKDLEFKTPGQRLRACLYVWFCQTPDPKPTFENWYNEKMEVLITHVKSKLQPQ